jgi:hypothetical protein
LVSNYLVTLLLNQRNKAYTSTLANITNHTQKAMTEKTIEILKSLKLGEKYSAYKPLGKQEIEEQGVLSKLKNLGILKLLKYSYTVENVKYLSKFIELQDFEKLVKYIENPNESENGIKSSLEYKILKHLKDNENGKPITLDNFHKNESLLRSKISELVKLKYITKVAELSLGTDFNVKGLRCEITINGIKYLNEIENKSENKNITNNNYGGTFIQDSDLKKARIINNPKTENNIPFKKSLIKQIISNPWLLLIVGALIAALLNSNRIMKFINENVDGI